VHAKKVYGLMELLFHLFLIFLRTGYGDKVSMPGKVPLMF
jgi:hypothetical protein